MLTSCVYSVSAITTSSSLPNGLSVPPMLTISTATPNAESEDDDADTDADAPTTPTANQPQTAGRKQFFAPITDFWSRRSASSSNGKASSSPSLPGTPELSGSEEVEGVSHAGDTSVEEVSVDDSQSHISATTDRSPSVDAVSVRTVTKSTADDPLPSNDMSTSSATTTTEDDAEDTETIKDGSVGRAAASQSGWLAKAFFGQQIEQDRGRRERGGEKFGSPRRRTGGTRAPNGVAATDSIRNPT